MARTRILLVFVCPYCRCALNPKTPSRPRRLGNLGSCAMPMRMGGMMARVIQCAAVFPDYYASAMPVRGEWTCTGPDREYEYVCAINRR